MVCTTFIQGFEGRILNWQVPNAQGGGGAFGGYEPVVVGVWVWSLLWFLVRQSLMILDLQVEPHWDRSAALLWPAC